MKIASRLLPSRGPQWTPSADPTSTWRTQGHQLAGAGGETSCAALLLLVTDESIGLVLIGYEIYTKYRIIRYPGITLLPYRDPRSDPGFSTWDNPGSNPGSNSVPTGEVSRVRPQCKENNLGRLFRWMHDLGSAQLGQIAEIFGGGVFYCLSVKGTCNRHQGSPNWSCEIPSSTVI